MASESPQPKKKRVPGIFLGVKGSLTARKDDNFNAICEQNV
jgi:hypothetical protein